MKDRELVLAGFSASHKFDQPILCPKNIFFRTCSLHESAMTTMVWRDEMNVGMAADGRYVEDPIRNEGIIMSRENKSGHGNLLEHMASAHPFIIVGRVEKSSIRGGIRVLKRA